MGIKDIFIHKSTDIAFYIIALANERKIAINMTKVQKLLYITYSVYLAVYNERLLDEHPKAWPYGPVFPTVRNKLLKYEDFSVITKRDIQDSKESAEISNNIRLNNVINFVLANFGTWNAGQLSEWSHIEGSPWHQTISQSNFKWGGEISDNMIYGYFSQLVTITTGGDNEQ